MIDMAAPRRQSSRSNSMHRIRIPIDRHASRGIGKYTLVVFTYSSYRASLSCNTARVRSEHTTGPYSFSARCHIIAMAIKTEAYVYELPLMHVAQSET